MDFTTQAEVFENIDDRYIVTAFVLNQFKPETLQECVYGFPSTEQHRA